MYKDSMVICPCFKSTQNSRDEDYSRFELLPIAFFGINSNGRNILFAFALVTPDDISSHEFVFRQFEIYMEQPPRFIVLRRLPFDSAFY